MHDEKIVQLQYQIEEKWWGTTAHMKGNGEARRLKRIDFVPHLLQLLAWYISDRENMGVCESCLKQQEDEDRKPLLTKVEIPDVLLVPQKEEETKKDWHQSVIDEANLHFISSDNRHRHRMKQTPDEIRLKLNAASVDPSLATSPFMWFSQDDASSNTRTDSIQDVVNILSEPVGVSDRLDAGADEIAQILSSHIRTDRHNDKIGRDGSLVAHLKPVILPNSGN